MDKQRILVVDDEEDLREILKFNLESEGILQFHLLYQSRYHILKV